MFPTRSRKRSTTRARLPTSSRTSTREELEEARDELEQARDELEPQVEEAAGEAA